jgi:hypothetical protein
MKRREPRIRGKASVGNIPIPGTASTGNSQRQTKPLVCLVQLSLARLKGGLHCP